MVTAYYTEINDLLLEEAISRHTGKFPKVMKEKILAYNSQQEQLSRLCGKLLLSKLLLDIGASATVNDMKYYESGKPYLDGGFDFNIAHSGNMVICCGTTGANIGVDIEKHTEIDINMMQEYFTTREWDKITCSNEPADTFYKIWTRKEACVKATGKGSLQPLSEIDVCQQAIIMDNTKWYMHDIFIRNGYSACITLNKNDKITLTEVDIKKLINGTDYDA